MAPPLIHLGAVTYSHNVTPYAIRAEVSFDFRSQGTLSSIRLSPLKLPESPDSVASAIDVVLRGRWQAALSTIRKRAVLEIWNAPVKRSDDVDVNPVRLELSDPSDANVAVYVLNTDMTPVYSITGQGLSMGPQPCSHAVVASFQGRFSPWDPLSQHATSHTRVTVADSRRQYEYTPIGVLSDPEGSIPFNHAKKFNLFGVVIDCRASSVAKTGVLRSEIVIADESSVLADDPEKLRTIAVHTFEEDPKDAIPFRAVGDIVRIHRVLLKEFNVHGSGELRRSANARFYTSFVLWEYEGTDFLPFTTREPVRQQHAEHRISSSDRNRVRQLRKWAKNYVFKHHTIQRDNLLTPTDIMKASCGSWGLSGLIDVLCLLEPDTYIDESDGVLTFLAADGFLPGNRTTRIPVQSESMRNSDHPYDTSSFVQLCPSWRLRPTGRPAWLVLRDVVIKERTGGRVIMLQAGSRTSSIIWNFEGSPDYRRVKKRLRMSQTEPEPSSTINPARVSTGYGYGVQPVTENALAPPAPNPQSIPRPHRHPEHVNDLRNQISGPVSNGNHHGIVHEERRNSSKRPRPEGNIRAFTSPIRQRRNSSTTVQRGEAQSSGAPPSRPTSETVVRSMPLRRELVVITENDHGDVPFSSIARMLKTLREGNTKAHRLKVTARVCSAPKHIRSTCRPWCKRCDKYLKTQTDFRRLECVTCGETFSGTQDPKMTWVYCVKVVLEDSAGGRIDAWIEGKEATTFFSGLSPTNLFSNRDARRMVSKTLQAVLISKHRLDCCVKPYEYEDKQGFYRVACKIFGTRLLPQYVGNR